MTELRTRHGFTLIELMLVASIVGLLTSVLVPKFGEMIQKAKEAALKGKIGSIRSMISIYYADNEGMFPLQETLSGLWGNVITLPDTLIPKYAAKAEEFRIIIPLPGNRRHGRGSGSIYYPAPFTAPNRNHLSSRISDVGATMYCPMGGDFFLFCTHRDVQGHPWSEF